MDEQTQHLAEKAEFYESEIDRWIKDLSENLGDETIPPVRRTDWRRFILKRLAQDCASYDEMLALIEERRGHGGISSRDILTGVLNQLDDDGLIYLNKAYGVRWYHLSKRGRSRYAA